MNLDMFLKHGNIFRRINIQKRLIASFLIVSVVPLSLVAMFAYLKSSNAIQDKILTYTKQLVRQENTIIQNETAKYNNILNGMIVDKTINNNLRTFVGNDMQMSIKAEKDLMDTLTSNLFSYPNVVSFRIKFSKEDNKELKYGNILTFKSEDEQKAMFEQMDKTSNIIWSVFTTNDDKKYLFAGKKINNKAINDTEYAYLVLKGDSISSLLKDIQSDHKSRVFILNEQNVIVGDADNKNVGTVFKQTDMLDKLKAGNEGAFDSNTDGDKQLVTYVKLPKLNWKLVVTTPYSFMNKETVEIRQLILLVTVICLFISIFLSIAITQSISNPLKKLVKTMKETKGGNLGISIKDTAKDEISVVNTNFNEMIDNIRLLVTKVKQSIDIVQEKSDSITKESGLSFRAATYIATTLQEVAEGTSEQASDIADSLNHVSVMSDSINQVGNIAENVAGVVDQAKKLSKDASLVVESLMNRTVETDSATTMIVKNINLLSDNIKEIEKIVNVIAGIAKQTNLLALNASIEAARAGDAGKGFRVVAEEVKKLAAQSTEASDVISKIIGGIQDKTEIALASSNTVHNAIADQIRTVKQTNSAFKEISSGMEQVSSKVGQMETSVLSVIEAKNNVLNNMQNISAVSEQSAATTQELSASTEEQMASYETLSNLVRDLNEMSTELGNAIALFKL